MDAPSAAILPSLGAKFYDFVPLCAALGAGFQVSVSVICLIGPWSVEVG